MPKWYGVCCPSIIEAQLAANGIRLQISVPGILVGSCIAIFISPRSRTTAGVGVALFSPNYFFPTDGMLALS